MEYNISEAELPTMVVRYESKLILRSVITGQHLEDLGYAPVWDDVPIAADLAARRQQVEAAYNEALENLVRMYPCEEPVLPQKSQPQPQLPSQPIFPCMPRQSPQTKPLPLVTARAPSPLAINETELPPCKVHRNYCCNYCNFCTQNPRSHLLHQRQVHGIRLSIHCCHHCQYASRYFQKLKRHVKMVHMGSSPGRTKIRNKTRRASKAKVTQQTISNDVEIKPQPNNQAELTKITPEEFNNEITQVPMHLPAQAVNLVAPSVGVAENLLQPKMLPAVLKNPEAFFEAAYRNQLIQQQLQMQRFKEFVKLSNQLKKGHQPASSQQSPAAAAALQPVVPQMKLQQKNQQLENINSQIKTKAPAPTALLPQSTNSPHSLTTNSHNHSPSNAANSELEKKRVYGCRKCSYVTHIKSRYNKHVKYHSMPMIQCDKCEFRTTYKWNLTRHLRSHHGNGLYKCSVCSFSAHMKQSLTSHELNHHSPPVGHITRIHNKPFRRRRCRVGGSDLVHDTSVMPNSLSLSNVLPTHKNLEPITADNQDEITNPISLIGQHEHESLKLVIKREAGTSSYVSSQTNQLSRPKQTDAAAIEVNQASDWLSAHPNPVNSTPLDKFGTINNIYTSSDSFSSSYTASPSSSCSNVSVVDLENALNSAGLPDFKPSTVPLIMPQQHTLINKSVAGMSELKVPEPLSTQHQLSSNTKAEAPLIPYISPQALTKLPAAQIVEYSSSVDSDPDSEDSDDSYSTVSANETVPHGLHIAYESSSPDRKSNSSDSETFSAVHSPKIPNTHETSQPNGLQENMTTS